MACAREDKRQCFLKEPVHILFMDLNLSFTPQQVQICIDMYHQGCPIEDIAKKVRPYDGRLTAIKETALLIFDLAEKKRIKPRATGVFGKEEKK